VLVRNETFNNLSGGIYKKRRATQGIPKILVLAAGVKVPVTVLHWMVFQNQQNRQRSVASALG
jgi:hypothetical protein